MCAGAPGCARGDGEAGHRWVAVWALIRCGVLSGFQLVSERAREGSTRSGRVLSLPAELRRAAGVVCRQPFLRVLSLEQALLELALQRKTLLEADLQPGRHGPLDESDRPRGLRRRNELPRVFQGTGAEL